MSKPIRRNSNPLYEKTFGRRLTIDQEVGLEPFPLIYEPDPPYYGVRCPLHPHGDLKWSEYNGWLWCDPCGKDIPDTVCVPLDMEPDPERPWLWRGIDMASDLHLWVGNIILEQHGVDVATVSVVE